MPTERTAPIGILLVEDNPGDADLIIHWLEEAPRRFEITTCGSIEASRVALTERTFDVILLDLGLPDGSGTGTFQKMSEVCGSIPVIVLTGLDDHEVAAQCLELGASDFLGKSMVEVFLARSIDNTLGRSRTQQKLAHLNRVLRAIRSVNQLIVHEKNPVHLVEKACSALVESRGYRGVWIALGKDGSAPTLVAEAGWGEHFAPFARQLDQGCWPRCRCLLEESETEFIVVDPVRSCTDCPLMACFDHDVAVVARLTHGEADFGMLGLSFPRGMGADDEELSLAQEVVGDIAFALHDIETEKQRDRYAQMVTGSAEAMALVDRDFRYLEVNQAFGRLVGRPDRSLVGKKLGVAKGVDFFSAVVRPKLVLAFGGEEVRFEADVGVDGADSVVIEALCSPCVAVDGIVSAVAVSVRDVTSQRRSEAARMLESQRAQQYLDIVNVIVTAIDDRGIVTMINQKGCEVLGYPEDEIVGKNWFEHFLTAEVKEKILPVSRALLDGNVEDVAYVENTVLTRGGEERLIGWHNTVVKDANGHIVGHLGSGEDITERRRHEADLLANEERFRGVFHGVTDGILLADEQRKFVLANQAMCRMLGYTADELIGLGLADIHPPDDLPRVAQAFAEQLAGERLLAADLPVLRKDGSVFFADINSTPIVIDGRPLLMGYFRDVSEKRELQASVAQSDRLASMGMLAAGVAHEINNPLAYVLFNLQSMIEDLPGLADSMKKSWKALRDREGEAGVAALVGNDFNPAMFEDVVDRAKDALTGTWRIRDIARGLGTFSRVEADDLSEVNVYQAIRCAIDMTSNEVKYRARLVEDYERLPAILASDGRVSQVFLNLLINAAHAIEEGDVEHNQIKVRAHVDEGDVCIEVSDTGKGISAEDLARIFDPFFTTKEVGLGSGLGLAICHNIVTDFGGTIEAESEVGVGTCFTVRFPVPREPTQSLPPGVVLTEDLPAVVRGRILVVDDEEGIRSALRRMLRDHELVLVSSGEEAQALLGDDEAFDLILCDMMMPRMSGMELHEWLVAHKPVLAARVVFVTGGAFTPRARAYLARVDAPTIEKPFDVRAFKQVVEERLAWARSAG